MEKCDREILLLKGTPIYIYGAGLEGRNIAETFFKHSFCVKGIMDRMFDKTDYKGMEIFNPFCDKNPNRLKEGAVVFISISNVFSHHSVAKELYDIGYNYIVYQDSIISKNDYSNVELFNLVQRFGWLDDEAIELFFNYANWKVYSYSFVSKVTKCALDLGNKEVVTHIPMEYIFGTSKEDYKKVSDEQELYAEKSIMEYFYTGQLYEAFERREISKEEWIEILDEAKGHFESCNIYNKEILDKQFERHLQQKYDLYQNMSELLFSYPEFFENNPSRVKWDDSENKHYFTIVDGNNRIAFLLAKGIFDIPCRISGDDYKKWKNYTANVISDPSKISIYYRDSLFQICRWLKKNQIETKNKKILCLEDIGDYMKNHFIRMSGGSVYSCVNDQVGNLDILVQDISYQNNDNEIYAKHKIIETEYENKIENMDIICQKVKGNRLYIWQGL